MLSFIAILFSIYFLYQERKYIASKFRKAQLSIYLIYPVGFSILILSNIFVVFLVIIGGFNEIIYLLQFLFFLFVEIAYLSFYVGMFPPSFVLRRMKVLPQTTVN